VKKKLSPFNTEEDDLFFWIKEYLGSRVDRLNVDKEFEGMLDCDKAYNQIISSNNIDELGKVTLDIRNNGIKALKSYTLPLFWIYICRFHSTFPLFSGIKQTYKVSTITRNIIFTLTLIFQFSL